MVRFGLVVLLALCFCEVASARESHLPVRNLGLSKGTGRARVYFGSYSTPEAAFREKEDIEKTDNGLATDKPYGLEVYKVTLVNGERTPVAREKVKKPEDQPLTKKDTPKPGVRIQTPEFKWVDPGAYNSPLDKSELKSTIAGSTWHPSGVGTTFRFDYFLNMDGTFSTKYPDGRENARGKWAERGNKVVVTWDDGGEMVVEPATNGEMKATYTKGYMSGKTFTWKKK